MNSRLVNTCTTIIRILPSTGLNVNGIIKQTSPDREHVIEAIDALKHGSLVIQESSATHKQKKIVKLTDLGNEIRRIFNDSCNYNKSYSQLEAQIEYFKNYYNDYFEILVAKKLGKNSKKFENIFVGKLLNEGWSNDDIKLFDNLDSGLYFVNDMCRRNIFLILLYRYARVYYKFDLNEIAKSILTTVIFDEIKFHLNHSLGGIEDRFRQRLDSDAKDSLLHDLVILCDPLENDLKRLYSGDYYLFRSRFTSPEIKNMILSIVQLARIGEMNLSHLVTETQHGLTLLGRKKKSKAAHMANKGGYSMECVRSNGTN
jgi:hypothetical protein